MASPNWNSVAQYFKRGDEIEINSNDQGFQGSWYAGTIIRLPENVERSSEVLVEYKTLMENEQSTKALREEVDLVQIRPFPPKENLRNFKINDDVDAYYCDGWWEGIVIDVLNDNNYLVFFRGSREQIPFKNSKLRQHREWVCRKGKWFPPFETLHTEPAPVSSCSHEELQGCSSPLRREPEKEKVNTDYTEGASIEVQNNGEGFEDSWYAAKILKKFKKDKYLVKYRKLRNDDDSGYFKEEVDRDQIRPCPPPLEMVDGYEVEEQVDAFYNDGWWVGEIHKVLINGNYIVYFENTGEELRFKHSDLRVHREWRNGKWIVPLKFLQKRKFKQKDT